MQTTPLFALVFAVGCASAPIKPITTHIAPAPAAETPAAAPRSANELELAVELSAITSDTDTKCKMQSHDPEGTRWLSSSASVDSGDPVAIGECWKAIFGSALDRQLAQQYGERYKPALAAAPASAPASAPEPATAKVVAYDFDEQIIHTPGSGIDLGSVVIQSEVLNKTSIKRALRDVDGRFANCATHAVSGTVTVQLQIAPSGDVASAQATTHVDPTLDDCVVGVARALEFPPSRQVTVVTYPIAFR